jgi:hypothetical protein
MKRLTILTMVPVLAALMSCNRILDSDPYSPEPPPPATIPPDPAVAMHHYYGNLHSHTTFSDGRGTPDQAFDWARNEAGFDFYAITDHGEMLFPSEWRAIGRSADAKNEDGRFVALRGFEWTHPEFGHITVLNTSSYTSAVVTLDPDYFYDWLDRHDGLAMFNHPGRTANNFQRFAHHDKTHDNFFATETGNGAFGNVSGVYLDHFGTALQQGWRLAPVNSQDNHRLSANAHRTVIIAPALTRRALYEALARRRLYSSDDPDLKLLFKSGDYWMGSNIVGARRDYPFEVGVEDDEPVTRIELLDRSGSVVDSFVPPAGQSRVTAHFTVHVSEHDCFYVKVYQEDTNGDEPGHDHQITLSSPIWVFPR